MRRFCGTSEKAQGTFLRSTLFFGYLHENIVTTQINGNCFLTGLILFYHRCARAVSGRYDGPEPDSLGVALGKPWPGRWQSLTPPADQREASRGWPSGDRGVWPSSDRGGCARQRPQQCGVGCHRGTADTARDVKWSCTRQCVNTMRLSCEYGYLFSI